MNQRSDEMNYIDFLKSKQVTVMPSGFDVEVSNEGVTLSAKTTMGECSETLNIKAVNPIKIGFNVEYLAECFKNLPSTTAILKYAGGLSPAVITTLTGEAVSLVLPVRLNKESV